MASGFSERTVTSRGNFSHKGLGGRLPAEKPYAKKYPLRRLSRFAQAPAVVERNLSLPTRYRSRYDQGEEGACVGFSLSWLSSIHNRRLYAARWLYGEAQKIDPWPGEDYSGTSVDAGCQILRSQGHRRETVAAKVQRLFNADPRDGITAYRWATGVDDVRAAISAGTPVVFGINWYAAFDRPVQHNREWWIGAWQNMGGLGEIRGGHAICCYGASDRRQAVRLVNSWGNEYPDVWLPYTVLTRLFEEDGEGVIVTDR